MDKLKEMAKYNWVPATRKAAEKAANLRSFFEVANLPLVFNERALNVAYRRQSVSQKSEYALI